MAFATSEELALQLNITIDGDLAARAEFLLENATGLIASEAGYDDEWAATLDPVPRTLRAMAVDVAARAWTNPKSLRAQQEQLGSWQGSETHGTVGLGLTGEQLETLKTMFPKGVRSTRVQSVYRDIHPEPTDDELPLP